MLSPTDTPPLVLFDGECNLCNGAIQFIIRHDKRKLFRFGQLQSAAGAQQAEHLRQATGHLPDSIILYYKGKFHTRSGAALRILKLLGGGWALLYGFMIVPTFIRNGVYDIIARNRYKWFGKRSECMIPTPELKERFL